MIEFLPIRMKSPIIIFAYNRPKHLSNLIKSLEKNDLKNFKFFFFCDGPKITEDINQINKIKKIISQSKIKFQKKIFRKRNIGLANNIINGVNTVLKYNEQCIVLEDDLILNSKTIKFMNDALNKFKNNKKIGSVSAYSYLDDFNLFQKHNIFMTKRHSSWCWGTWSRVWKRVNWININYNSHFKNKSSIIKFSEAGKDLNLLLWGQYQNLINSWAIRFNFFCSQNNLSSIQPRYSMIINDGKDFSGTHEKFSFSRKKFNNFFPKKIDKILKSQKIDDYIKNNHRRSIKISIIYFLKNFRIL